MRPSSFCKLSTVPLKKLACVEKRVPSGIPALYCIRNKKTVVGLSEVAYLSSKKTASKSGEDGGAQLVFLVQRAMNFSQPLITTRMISTHRYSFSGRSRWNMLIKESEIYNCKDEGNQLVLTLLSDRSMESKHCRDIYNHSSAVFMTLQQKALTLRLLDVVCRPFRRCPVECLECCEYFAAIIVPRLHTQPFSITQLNARTISSMGTEQLS